MFLHAHLKLQQQQQQQQQQPQQQYLCSQSVDTVQSCTITQPQQYLCSQLVCGHCTLMHYHTAPEVPLQSVSQSFCGHHTLTHHHTATVCLPTLLVLRQANSKLQQFLMFALFYLINNMAPASAWNNYCIEGEIGKITAHVFVFRVCYVACWMFYL